MKKIIASFMSFIIAMTVVFSATASADRMSDMKAKYILLMDYDTGKVLYEKNADQKLYPASTTKIWTCYLTLKHCPDLNKKIKIENLPEIEGTSMYLKNGETFTIYGLLEGLMLQSANDAAYVLARYIGNGDPQKFYDLMNSEAKAVGATGTHFNCPHGLPDENHYTTARDMMKMSRVAMHDPRFRGLVRTTSVKFKGTEQNKYERHFFNSNKFLTSTQTMDYYGKQIPMRWDIVDGVKTGYTDDAGNCLVSSAVKNGHRLMAGVFKAPGGNLYLDSRTVLEYGFDNYNFFRIFNKDDYKKTKKVRFSNEKELFYEPEDGFCDIVRKDLKFDKSNYTVKEKLDKIKMPVKKGDVVGKLEVYSGNRKVSDINLIAMNDVTSRLDFLTLDYVKNNLQKVLIAILCFLLFILVIVWLVYSAVKRRKKKSKKASKRKSGRKAKRRRR